MYGERENIPCRLRTLACFKSFSKALWDRESISFTVRFSRLIWNSRSVQSDIALDDIALYSCYPTIDTTLQISTESSTTKMTLTTTADISSSLPPSAITSPQSSSLSSYECSSDCDFEGGVICSSWMHDATAEIQWTLNQGETSTFGTGPSVGQLQLNFVSIVVLQPFSNVDHTLANKEGYYIYVEASLPSKPNDRCRIVSIPIREPIYLEFWYVLSEE